MKERSYTLPLYTIVDMIYKHIIVLRPDNPGQPGYTGFFQDFPDIDAEGDTMEETKLRLKDAYDTKIFCT